MTDIDTEELRRLTREATPGPWTFGLRDDPDAPASVYRWQHSTKTPTGGRSGAAEAIAMSPRYGLERFRRGAPLIVAMRNALPALLDALDAKDREIAALRHVAERARRVVNSESVGQPSVDVRAMRELRSRLDALEAKDRRIADLLHEREMVAGCEPYRRSGACHCSTGIPGACALEASEAERGA